jgi:site-specific DNA recombinase
MIAYKGDWYPGEQPPLVTQEQWDRVQATRRERHDAQIPRDVTHHLLLGLLHDEHGRRMKIDVRGPEGRPLQRYYIAERTRMGDRKGWKRVSVVASDAEHLARSAIQTFVCDRAGLSQAIISLGFFDHETAALLNAGSRAARAIAKMDHIALRHLFEALIARAEVSRSEMRLLVRCQDLARLLEWDGVGTFRAGATIPKSNAARVHLLKIPATLVREHKYFAVPLTHPTSTGKPNPSLVSLLQKANAAKCALHENRGRSVAELAKALRVGPSYFSRLLRLNYLAPDIQTAIIDGTHPLRLTRKQLIYCSLPLDWEQQRQLLGFH